MTVLAGASPQMLREHQHQCSLDVEALYTSIPVTEALGVVRRKLLSNIAAVPNPLHPDDLIFLLKLVFEQTYFHFAGKVYRQIAGLPMGCAVSGIVAILFMEEIERAALVQFVHCPILLRYVDDVYALVRSADEARELQATLNGQHPSIRFALEQCKRQDTTTSLSLLDLTIHIDANGEVSFDFYEKEAKSDLFVHRDSALPWPQKAATVRNERRRIAERSSRTNEANQAAFNERLLASGYTESDLQRADTPIRRRRRRTDRESPIFYLDLPFLGDPVEHKIRGLFQREGVRLRIYRRSTTILDVVRPRQPEIRQCSWPDCPTKEAATCFVRNCVYELKCSPCDGRYIGSTTRALHERVREHTRTGRGSTIHAHLVRCGRGEAKVRVKILAREKDCVNTRLREAILIKKFQPCLNSREESDLTGLLF